MAKLKDGYYKQLAATIGSDNYLLLAGGGHKILTDFWTKDVFNPANYLALTGGTLTGNLYVKNGANGTHGPGLYVSSTTNESVFGNFVGGILKSYIRIGDGTTRKFTYHDTVAERNIWHSGNSNASGVEWNAKKFIVHGASSISSVVDFHGDNALKGYVGWNRTDDSMNLSNGISGKKLQLTNANKILYDGKELAFAAHNHSNLTYRTGYNFTDGFLATTDITAASASMLMAEIQINTYTSTTSTIKIQWYDYQADNKYLEVTGWIIGEDHEVRVGRVNNKVVLWVKRLRNYESCAVRIIRTTQNEDGVNRVVTMSNSAAPSDGMVVPLQKMAVGDFLPLSGGKITGELTLGNTGTGTPSSNVDRTSLIINPPNHTGGPWKINIKDTPTESIFRVLYGSTEKLTFGTTTGLKFGSSLVSLEGHTHNYAGSSTAGGAATSAIKLGSITGGTTTSPGDYGMHWSCQVGSTTAGIFPTSNNANAVFTINTHPGHYYHQLGFSGNGNMYRRYFSNSPLNTTQGWTRIWDSWNFNPDDKLNVSGGTITGNLTIQGSLNARGITLNDCNEAQDSFWQIYGWDKELQFTKRNSSGAHISSVLVFNYDTLKATFAGSIQANALTLSGALSFANFTWNNVGDDAALGDCNQAGKICIKALNNTEPGIAFYNNSGTHVGVLKSDAGTLKWGDQAVTLGNHSHSNIVIWDNRGADRAPNYYSSRAITAFFNESIPNAYGTWASGLNICGWDNVGYRSWQIFGYSSTSASNDIFIRTSNTSNSWNTPMKVWHDNNLVFGTGENNMARGNHSHNVIGSYNGTTSNAFQYWQSLNDTENNPSSTWWYGIRMSHGDANTYYSAQLAFNFYGNEIRYRRREGGTAHPWVYLWHSDNVGEFVKTRSSIAYSSMDSTRTSGVYNITNGAQMYRHLVAFNNGSGTHSNTLQLYGGWADNSLQFRYSNSDSSWDTWKSVWHNGNFDPGTKANTSGCAFSGTISAISRGNDYHTLAFMANGNGSANTINPGYGFHQPNVYAGSLQMHNATDFYFWRQGAATRANVFAAQIHANDWLRTSGATGWYNETYGGGMYMTDASTVRVSHNKAFAVANTASTSISTSGGVQANGFYKLNSSNAYILLGGGGHMQKGPQIWLGARCNFYNGQHTGKIGVAINYTIRYVSMGNWTITHNYGDTAYTVQANPYWEAGWNNSGVHLGSHCRIEDIQANSFRVRMVNQDNGNLVHSNIIFTMFAY